MVQACLNWCDVRAQQCSKLLCCCITSSHNSPQPKAKEPHAKVPLLPFQQALAHWLVGGALKVTLWLETAAYGTVSACKSRSHNSNPSCSSHCLSAGHVYGAFKFSHRGYCPKTLFYQNLIKDFKQAPAFMCFVIFWVISARKYNLIRNWP